jgi:hypothetical protein
MGVANLPRIYFRGTTYWNPSTMNNNDYQPTYDPASATLNWAWLERHGLEDADGFDEYATGETILPLPNDPMLIPAGLQTAQPPAEWNFYGDNSCGFVQPNEPVIEWPAKFKKPPGGTTVTGFTNDQGNLVTTGDTWIGQPVHVGAGPDFAKLVDVDPTAPWSSQIFADSFGLGDADAKVGVGGTTAGRAHSRWVFFARNNPADVIIAGMASAMFQFAIPKAGLKVFDPAPAPGPLAAQLKAALAKSGVRGLMARFVTYHTVYFQGDAFKVNNTTDWAAITTLYKAYADAMKQYASGGLASAPPQPVNRAYSTTVGWIGPWMASDMQSMAVGRIFHSAGPIKSDNGGGVTTPIGPAALEYALDPSNPNLVGRVSIDLGSTIPEFGGGLTKLDFGKLQLAFEAGTGGPIKPFAEIPYAGGYDTPTYDATSGVVDVDSKRFLVPVSVGDIANRLVVQFVSTLNGTQVGLREADFTAETDDRAIYLNEPGVGSTDRTLAVQVRFRGGQPPQGTKLRIAQYGPVTPGFNETDWQLVSDGKKQLQTPFARLISNDPVTDGAYVTVPVSAAADGPPYGTASIAVSALRSGPPVLQFTPIPPGKTQPPPGATIPFFNTAETFFTNVRVLPFHNAMAAAFENWLRTGPSVDLASQRVFDAVFRTFFLMYPAMRFLRDPLQFQAWRGPITALTDPSRFEAAGYMPVTRSLSAGQRRMLELWDAYLDGRIPTPLRGGTPVGRRS